MSWTTVPVETRHPQLSLEKNHGEGFYIFVYRKPTDLSACKVVRVSDDLFEALNQFEVACRVVEGLFPTQEQTSLF